MGIRRYMGFCRCPVWKEIPKIVADNRGFSSKK
jgi:hypothetical protein